MTTDKDAEAVWHLERREWAVLLTGIVIYLSAHGLGSSPLEAFLAAAFGMTAVTTAVIVVMLSG